MASTNGNASTWELGDCVVIAGLELDVPTLVWLLLFLRKAPPKESSSPILRSNAHQIRLWMKEKYNLNISQKDIIFLRNGVYYGEVDDTDSIMSNAGGTTPGTVRTRTSRRRGRRPAAGPRESLTSESPAVTRMSPPPAHTGLRKAIAPIEADGERVKLSRWPFNLKFKIQLEVDHHSDCG